MLSSPNALPTLFPELTFTLLTIGTFCRQMSNTAFSRRAFRGVAQILQVCFYFVARPEQVSITFNI